MPRGGPHKRKRGEDDDEDEEEDEGTKMDVDRSTGSKDERRKSRMEFVGASALRFELPSAHWFIKRIENLPPSPPGRLTDTRLAKGKVTISLADSFRLFDPKHRPNKDWEPNGVFWLPRDQMPKKFDESTLKDAFIFAVYPQDAAHCFLLAPKYERRQGKLVYDELEFVGGFTFAQIRSAPYGVLIDCGELPWDGNEKILFTPPYHLRFKPELPHHIPGRYRNGEGFKFLMLEEGAEVEVEDEVNKELSDTEYGRQYSSEPIDGLWLYSFSVKDEWLPEIPGLEGSLDDGFYYFGVYGGNDTKGKPLYNRCFVLDPATLEPVDREYLRQNQLDVMRAVHFAARAPEMAPPPPPLDTPRVYVPVDTRAGYCVAGALACSGLLVPEAVAAVHTLGSQLASLEPVANVLFRQFKLVLLKTRAMYPFPVDTYRHGLLSWVVAQTEGLYLCATKSPGMDHAVLVDCGRRLFFDPADQELDGFVRGRHLSIEDLASVRLFSFSQARRLVTAAQQRSCKRPAPEDFCLPSAKRQI